MLSYYLLSSLAAILGSAPGGTRPSPASRSPVGTEDPCLRLTSCRGFQRNHGYCLLLSSRNDDSQEREAQRARVARHEQLADRAVAAAISEAARRGEYVSPVDAVNGRIGRTVEEILLGAQGEVADRVPKPLREPNPDRGVWLGAGEPVILPARSANGLRLFNRMRHFMDMLEARQRAEQAQRTAVVTKHHIGLPAGAPPRPGRRP